MSNAVWFVVMTRPLAEDATDRRLQKLGVRTFYPHFPHWIHRDGQTSRLARLPFLPRYFFVDPSPIGGRFDVIRDCKGVVGIVKGASDEPCPIPAKAMAKIESRTDSGGAIIKDASGSLYKSGKIRPIFDGEIGDNVRLLEKNPFFGFVAAIKRIDTDGSITMELELFGRAVEVSAPADQCELTPKPKAG